MRLRGIYCLGLALLLAGTRLLAQSPETKPAGTNSTTNSAQGSVTNAPSALVTNAQPGAPTNMAAIEASEGNIAHLTSMLLQAQHFTRHPFDAEISGRFYDRFFDTLDRSHTFFIQSDLDEFGRFRTNMNVLTVNRDVSLGKLVFARFMERAAQRNQFITNSLATEQFEFTNNDRFVTDRHTLSSPKDMTDAQVLWHQEARYEYLQEKLQAQNVRYYGPIGKSGGEGSSWDSQTNVTIRLTRNKLRPSPFDFLPSQLFDSKGARIGGVTVEDPSNAVVNLSIIAGEKLAGLTRTLCASDGKELGKITLRLQTNDTGIATNAAVTNAAAATNGLAAGTISYIGSIQLNCIDPNAIRDTVIKRYARMMNNLKDLDWEDTFEIYLNSLARAYDPHTDYMAQRQSDNFDISIKHKLIGIGAMLETDDVYCKIKELTPGGPAEKDGRLKPGDRIIAVAQGDKEPLDVVGMKVNTIVQHIRGEKGTEVRLTIIPASSPDGSERKIISLTRDEVHTVDQVAKAVIYDVSTNDGGSRLGVINLPSFYGDNEHTSATADVAKLLKRFKTEHVNGVILDLRNNGGGLLDEAVNLTGLFIADGPVVQTKDGRDIRNGREGAIVVDSDTDSSIEYDGPMIVLINRYTASASEIVAGALQDYGRAIIVGDRASFGKGTVQQPEELDPILDGLKLQHEFKAGRLKLTLKKFYRAGGSSTQLDGVQSDIILPSVLNYQEVGESALEYPMEHDTIPPAKFQKLNRVEPFLTSIKERSIQRVRKDKDFEYVQEDIKQYTNSLVDKSVSLNEAARLAEKKENDARQEARKKERQARPKSSEKAYELTLNNITNSVLEPLAPKTNAVALAVDAANAADETADDSKAPDPALEESKRILIDYMAALDSKAPATVRAESNTNAPAKAVAPAAGTPP